MNEMNTRSAQYSLDENQIQKKHISCCEEKRTKWAKQTKFEKKKSGGKQFNSRRRILKEKHGNFFQRADFENVEKTEYIRIFTVSEQKIKTTKNTTTINRCENERKSIQSN